jgi:hypothetical protein
MDLDKLGPDQKRYLAPGETEVLSARLHPIAAVLPFLRVVGLILLVRALGTAEAPVMIGALLLVLAAWLTTTFHQVDLLTAVALVVAGYLAAIVYGMADTVAGLGLLAALVVAVIELVDFFRTKIFLTDRRLFRVSGLFTSVVATMPLRSLTDLRFDQTLPGKILNYGHFAVESAGQRQALSELRFVAHPGHFYKQVMGEALGGAIAPAPAPETEDSPPA